MKSKITADLTFDDSKARQVVGWEQQGVLDYLKRNKILITLNSERLQKLTESYVVSKLKDSPSYWETIA